MKLSNQARRFPHVFLGSNPHQKPLMPENEFQALQNAKPAVPKPGKLNARQLRRVKKYLPRIRLCQKRGQRPRSVPKEVLELVIAHKLLINKDV